MGTEMAIERERLTAREVQILDHLEQAQSLGVPLTEYASPYDVDVRDLYNGKAGLVKKGILPRTLVTTAKCSSYPVTIFPASALEVGEG
jgi:hypothetical protein